MTEKAHVLLEKGEPYTAVLNMVDLASGRNSYYKLQILESDKSNKYDIAQVVLRCIFTTDRLML